MPHHNGRYRYLLGVITAIVIAFSGSVAAAAKWNNADVVRAIAVADNHWPASPCKGRERLQWIDQFHKVIYKDENVTAYALQDGSCLVVLIWDVIWYSNPKPSYLCAVLEHEFGHLAGLGHSPDPHDIMYPYTEHPFGDCLAAFPNPKVRHANR